MNAAKFNDNLGDFQDDLHSFVHLLNLNLVSQESQTKRLPPVPHLSHSQGQLP